MPGEDRRIHQLQKDMFILICHRNKHPVSIYKKMKKIFGCESISLMTCFDWYYECRRKNQILNDQ
ncbi:unnamed protein product [Nezara viridula]|uniref:Uncharacterized protein n=1 Tax=Nezara viridula TaxID=85310 RepID=A0A9P0MRK8_NEZVI|nr:unnamed protein product [Nezara viridula]